MKKSLRYLIFFAFVFSQCGKEGNLPAYNSNNPPASYNHRLYPGNSAKDFLRSTIFKSLQVEIQYMPGFKPEPSLISLFQEFLESRLHKPEGIFIQVKEIDPTLKTVFSDEDISEMENNNRTIYTSGNQLSAYILFIDGSYLNGNVLALAYRNTSLCLFGEPFKYFSIGTGEKAKAYAMTMLAEHEFGHLLGLVDCGTNMLTDHQDPLHSHHCVYSNCLMHHSFETQARIFGRSNLEIPAFDQACLEDLKANGGN